MIVGCERFIIEEDDDGAGVKVGLMVHDYGVCLGHD
jgi:hypothetical protein